MRKADPAYLKAQYSEQIDHMLAYLNRVAGALRASPNQKADVSHLSESVFMDAVVEFEQFVSDLFVTYVNRDFTQFQNDLSQRISQSIKEKYGNWAESRTRFSTVAHMPVDQIEEILDPKAQIITFVGSDKMIDAARKWINARDNSGIVGMSTADKSLIDTARSIRHYIAHGSDRAYTEMNDRLAIIDQGPPNDGMGRTQHKVNNIGSFLKTEINNGRRVEKYLRRLNSVFSGM